MFYLKRRFYGLVLAFVLVFVNCVPAFASVKTVVASSPVGNSSTSGLNSVQYPSSSGGTIGGYGTPIMGVTGNTALDTVQYYLNVQADPVYAGMNMGIDCNVTTVAFDKSGKYLGVIEQSTYYTTYSDWVGITNSSMQAMGIDYNNVYSVQVLVQPYAGTIACAYFKELKTTSVEDDTFPDGT